MYSNWRIKKSDLASEELGEKLQQEQAQVGDWCTKNQQYQISDDEEYIFVEPIPEPTEEEKAQAARATRDNYLIQYVDAVVSNPLRWADMSQEEQEAIIQYRRYLLDIPQSEGFPDVEVLDFENWKENNNA